MADAVTLGQLATGEVRVVFHVPTQQEKGGADAFALESVENSRGGAWPWSIVEGEHQFLGSKRQRGGEMLASDPRRGPSVDLDHPFGAERLRISRARFRPGCPRSKAKSNGSGNRNGKDAN